MEAAQCLAVLKTSGISSSSSVKNLPVCTYKNKDTTLSGHIWFAAGYMLPVNWAIFMVDALSDDGKASWPDKEISKYVTFTPFVKNSNKLKGFQ